MRYLHGNLLIQDFFQNTLPVSRIRYLPGIRISRGWLPVCGHLNVIHHSDRFTGRLVYSRPVNLCEVLLNFLWSGRVCGLYRNNVFSVYQTGLQTIPIGILAGPNNPFMQLCKYVERFFARPGSLHMIIEKIGGNVIIRDMQRSGASQKIQSLHANREAPGRSRDNRQRESGKDFLHWQACGIRAAQIKSEFPDVF